MIYKTNKANKADDCNAIAIFIVSLLILLVFLTIGPFRSILTIFVFCISLSICILIGINRNTIGLPFVAIFIYALIVDIDKGGLWGSMRSLPVSLFSSFAIFIIFHKRTMLLVQKAKKNKCFSICPRCYYFSSDMVCFCIKCDFSSEDSSYIYNTKYDEDIIRSVVVNKVGDDVDPFIVKMPFLDFLGYLNDVYIRFTHLSVSNNHIIMIESGFFSDDCWRGIYVINKKDVSSVVFMKKNIIKSKRYSLEITLNTGDKYVILFKCSNKKLIFFESIKKELLKFCSNDGESTLFVENIK